MLLSYSFIIPVFNRPEELRELLQSIVGLSFAGAFEVVVIEDGSQQDASEVIFDYKDRLSLVYLQKENTGPGDSRNFGMARASGNYFIVLDSDCILPPQYLSEVDTALKAQYVDCFGGPDAAHDSFTTMQKAINYAMTSLLSTGGIRGKKMGIGRFQPRSFNMGLSKKAFEATGGFGRIHPGEDPDLSIRLWKNGFNTKLIPNACVYHKRRVDFKRFFNQVKKFGQVRPILNEWHPETKSPVYWFPSLFCIGFLGAIIWCFLFRFPYNLLLIVPFLFYFSLVFIDALKNSRKLKVAILAVLAITIQFMGYGYGFLKSTILIKFSKRKPQELFPELFF